MSGFDCDLLVVGLGPTGDALAALARLHGLAVIGIDQAPAPHPLPRAAIVDHEIMRIFQTIGAADRIAADMRTPDRYQFLTAGGEILLDFPIAARGAYGWAEAYAIHQPSIEHVLRDRLADLGGDIRNGVAFAGLAQDADGVTVRVTGADDATSTIRARYVVGCDGAGSPVRQALGIGLDDFDFDEPWLVIDALLDDAHALPVVARQICDPRRPVTHLAMNAGRYRWEFMIKPGEDPATVLDDGFIRALLAPWGCADHARIERKAVYRFHGLIAQDWRRGRVLLAGDAAHQMPPFAGQGMCSGIRDAMNLAWKLAAVIAGGAPAALLDSYREERAPHVGAILETAIAMGRVVCLLDETAAAHRDAEMLARKASGAQDVSTAYPDLVGGLFTTTPAAGSLLPQPVVGERWFDDLLGPGAALIGRDLPALAAAGADAAPVAVRRLDLADPALAPFAPALAAWLAGLGAAAALVRPDRHVFGTGAADPLLAAWADGLGVAVPA